MSLSVDVSQVLAMAPPAGGQGQQSPMFMFVWLGLMIAIFYFMLIRPQKRKEKDRRNLINAVKTGDRILFCGGMVGQVSNVKDKVLTVKIADKVKVDIVRGAVAQVFSKDESPSEDPTS